MENIFLHKKVSYLQGILNNFNEQDNLQDTVNHINEQDTSFLYCKHKHMMKCGAPPDKVKVLYRLLSIEFHGFTSKIYF